MSERYRDGGLPWSRDEVSDYVKRRAQDDADALAQLVLAIMVTLEDEQFDEVAAAFGFTVNE